MNHQEIPHHPIYRHARLQLSAILGLLALLIFLTPHTASAAPLHAPLAAEAPLDDLSQIAGGMYHTCAITTGGGVKCWGDNAYGQLGDSSTSDRALPVVVSGLHSGVKAVALGATHTCAITAAGGVKCWGDNSSGQLGNNSMTSSATPVDVSGLSSGVTAIAAGSSHTCAVVNGGVKCWGENWQGQLGNGVSEERQLTPVDVVGLSSGVSALSTGVTADVEGGEFTCALTTGGGVKCWGTDWQGQLGDGGDGYDSNSYVPVDVAGLGSGVIAITSGEAHSCALLNNGSVRCWGANYYGMLGDGGSTGRFAPVNVVDMSSGVTAIAAGGKHTCALINGGGVKCWGANSHGQLGDGSTTNRLTPMTVVGLGAPIAKLAAGGNHTCAIRSDSGLLCWGSTSDGQLGDGSIASRTTPADVAGLSSGVLAISAGNDNSDDAHSCALTAGGGIKCWGNNSAGQLGNGTTNPQPTPVDVINLFGEATSVKSGGSHTCAIVSGAAMCWGGNSWGQLGDGTTTTRLTPVTVSGLTSGVTAIATGSTHTCAVVNGGVRCWGSNFFGELGLNTGTTYSSTPVNVTGLASGVTAVAAGSSLSCALTSGGAVRCWGENNLGQLGNGTTNNISNYTPVNVSGLSSGGTAITTGGNHACALISGGMRCWGANYYGGLGDGSTTARSTPVNVTGLGSGVTAIAAGGLHSCALTIAGGVKCWGENFSGEVGDGSTLTRTTPVDVSGLSSGVTAIATGNDHTCARTSTGGVKCWGRNLSGELGNGSNQRSLPASAQATCYALTLTNVGSGGVPVATADRSSTCPVSNYFALEMVTLNATPAAGWRISGWNGTANNSSTAASNSLIMPAANHSAGVTYVEEGKPLAPSCYPLTLLHSGSGSDPLAEPPNSPDCPTGHYTAGSEITLNASPANGWQVDAWVGSNDDGSKANQNTLTMPAAQRTVNVAYASLPETTPAGGADEFEVDDTCGQAALIPADGTSQTHTFHQVGDTDWVRFDAGGGNYRVEVQVLPGSLADVKLEVFQGCEEAASDRFAATFTPGVRLDFPAPATGVVYLRLANSDVATAGAQVSYHLSVRRLEAASAKGGLILVAGRLKTPDALQANIEKVTQAVYDLYRANGYSDEEILYLVTNPELPGYDQPATVENLQAAITQWAATHAGADKLLTLYLMDHGDVDKFYIDGVNQQEFTPAQLNGWLDQLEEAVAGIKITVVIEACNSGSFIEGLETISQPGRLIISSTTHKDVAYASAAGAFFSDQFVMSLRQGYSLFNSYRAAYAGTRELTNLLQEPWLDGNGNGIPNEPEDVTIASRMRNGTDAVSGDTWAPYIISATAPAQIMDRRGIFQAVVRDNKEVRRVWAVFYPPSYRPPGNQVELVPETQPSIILHKQGDGETFQGEYAGFDEVGPFRIVIYAEDNDGLMAQPYFLNGPPPLKLYIPNLMLSEEVED